MFCCDSLGEAVDRGKLYFGSKNRIDESRSVNDIDTEYFIRSAPRRGDDYLGINYCPFCGRALSYGLWTAEKKEQVAVCPWSVALRQSSSVVSSLL